MKILISLKTKDLNSFFEPSIIKLMEIVPIYLEPCKDKTTSEDVPYIMGVAEMSLFHSDPQGWHYKVSL